MGLLYEVTLAIKQHHAARPFGCDDCGDIDCTGECEVNTVFPPREVDETTEREDMDADARYAWRSEK